MFFNQSQLLDAFVASTSLVASSAVVIVLVLIIGLLLIGGQKPVRAA